MTKTGNTAAGSVRLIGGEWRSRKLSFPNANGLRPTADRVRETLFNWLQSQVPAARVLDLFAGSGALGFEAASRGASQVLMLELRKEAAASLHANREALQAKQVEVVAGDAFTWLESAGARGDTGFDIVFIDPPFAENWHYRAAAALASSAVLAPNAWVYIETAAPLDHTRLPAHWREHRSKRAGAVYSTLLQCGEKAGS